MVQFQCIKLLPWDPICSATVDLRVAVLLYVKTAFQKPVACTALSM